MTSIERVIQEIIKLVTENPAGVRHSVLHRTIMKKHPDIPSNTIHGSLLKFRTHLAVEIYLPAKGLYFSMV